MAISIYTVLGLCLDADGSVYPGLSAPQDQFPST